MDLSTATELATLVDTTMPGAIAEVRKSETKIEDWLVRVVVTPASGRRVIFSIVDGHYFGFGR